MRTTNKGMAQIRHAKFKIEQFIDHGRKGTTQPVRKLYISCMETESVVRTGRFLNQEYFDQWAFAQDKIFASIIQMGYGVHEVRTGK